MASIVVNRDEILSMSDEDQRRETFAYYGLACYQVQCVERQMAILLAITEFPIIDPGQGVEFNKYLDGSFERTFGQLLTRIRKLDVDENVVARLNDALEKRNWLAHHYFWDRATTLLTRKGRCQMILELVDLANTFSELDDQLTRICTEWNERNGITEDVQMSYLQLSIAKEE